MKSRIAAALLLALLLMTGSAFAKTTKAQNSNTATTNTAAPKMGGKHRRHRRHARRRHRRHRSGGSMKNANAAAKNTNSH